jgi:hypothetical protein
VSGFGSQNRPVPRIGSTLLVLGVLGSTAAAFAMAERLKLQKVPIEATRVDTVFSPVCACALNRAGITLRVRRPDSLSIRLLNKDGDTVRVLAHSRRIRNGLITFWWDGTDDDGSLVSDGTYSVQLELERQGRSIRLPRKIVVDTGAPVARLVAVVPRVLRHGAQTRVTVRYRLNQPAHAVLFVNRHRVIQTFSSRPVGEFHWYAGSNGVPLRRGRYSLRLAGVDDAGNLGPLTAPVTVVVR